ncbi:unnamed protein product, partial [Aphanomyces euteiches]
CTIPTTIETITRRSARCLTNHLRVAWCSIGVRCCGKLIGPSATGATPFGRRVVAGEASLVAEPTTKRKKNCIFEVRNTPLISLMIVVVIDGPTLTAFLQLWIKDPMLTIKAPTAPRTVIPTTMLNLPTLLRPVAQRT